MPNIPSILKLLPKCICNLFAKCGEIQLNEKKNGKDEDRNEKTTQKKRLYNQTEIDRYRQRDRRNCISKFICWLYQFDVQIDVMCFYATKNHEPSET